jgi:hypothetical protein
LLLGAVNVTVALALPAVAVAPVGAPGTVALAVGVTAVVFAENAPVPCALVARTLKVYAVPLTRGKSVALVAVLPTVTLTAPGVDPTM